MPFTDFTLRLMFLFLPGIISIGIIYFFTTSKPIKLYFYIVFAFILGTLSYLILIIFKNDVSFLICLFDKNQLIDTKEILFGSLIGFILGIVITYAITYEIFHQIARKIKMSNKFSEANVWSHLLNSPDIQDSWVLLRDKNEDLMYDGWIEYYSDAIEDYEIFLREVEVYIDSTGEHLYSLDGIYLMNKSSNFTLEFKDI